MLHFAGIHAWSMELIIIDMTTYSSVACKEYQLLNICLNSLNSYMKLNCQKISVNKIARVLKFLRDLHGWVQICQ